jgi:hypothetical protein
MTLFETKPFDDAVTEFKRILAVNPLLYSSGQFYATSLARASLLADLATSLANDLCLTFLGRSRNRDLVRRLVSKVAPLLSEPYAQALIQRTLTDPSNVGDCVLTSALQLFQTATPTPAETAGAKRTFDGIWSDARIEDTPYLYTPSGTFSRYIAAKLLDNVQCFQVSQSMANKVLPSRGGSSVPSRDRISQGLIAQACVVDPGQSPGPDQRPQTVRYLDQASLQATASAMEHVIDSKGLVQCGVLSGVRQDSGGLQPCGAKPSSALPQPEHYLLVFAHGELSGKKAFLFWDPDANRSNIAATNWGPGFGCLFSDSGRLSTAFDNDDLQAVIVDARSDFEGDHAQDPRRHRYQVYYARSLPQ